MFTRFFLLLSLFITFQACNEDSGMTIKESLSQYPYVMDIFPPNGATGLPMDTNFSIKFSKTMNSNLFENIVFQTNTSNVLNLFRSDFGALTINSDTSIISFDSSTYYTDVAQFTISIPTTVEDTTGKELLSSYKSTFSVSRIDRFNAIFTTLDVALSPNKDYLYIANLGAGPNSEIRTFKYDSVSTKFDYNKTSGKNSTTKMSSPIYGDYMSAVGNILIASNGTILNKLQFNEKSDQLESLLVMDLNNSGSFAGDVSNIISLKSSSDGKWVCLIKKVTTPGEKYILHVASTSNLNNFMEYSLGQGVNEPMSLSVSDNGNKIMIGMPYFMVKVFEHNTQTNTITKDILIKDLVVNISNGAGTSVAISGDGAIIAYTSSDTLFFAQLNANAYEPYGNMNRTATNIGQSLALSQDGSYLVTGNIYGTYGGTSKYYRAKDFNTTSPYQNYRINDYPGSGATNSSGEYLGFNVALTSDGSMHVSYTDSDIVLMK